MARDEVTRGSNKRTQPGPAEQTATVPAPPAPPAEARPTPALPGSTAVSANPVYAAQVPYAPYATAGQPASSRTRVVIIALIVGILGAIAIAVALVVVASRDSETNTAPIAKIGDCYVNQNAGSSQPVNPAYGPCTMESNAVVFYVTTYEGSSSPGDATLNNELFEACSTPEAVQNFGDTAGVEYYVDYYLPYADTWDTDPHTVICGLSTESGPVDPGVVLA